MFEYASFKVRIDWNQPQYFISTEVDRNTAWRQSSVLGDFRIDTCQEEFFLERDFPISKHHLISQRYYDRFG